MLTVNICSSNIFEKLSGAEFYQVLCFSHRFIDNVKAYSSHSNITFSLSPEIITGTIEQSELRFKHEDQDGILKKIPNNLLCLNDVTDFDNTDINPVQTTAIGFNKIAGAPKQKFGAHISHQGC